MNIELAKKLASSLRRSNGRLHLSAVIEDSNYGPRVAFLGGDHGEYSIDVGVSSRERVLAHWWGYCEANGLRKPAVGERVRFIGHNGVRYVGRISWVGDTRCRIHFKRRNGSECEQTYTIDSIDIQSSPKISEVSR